MSTAIYNINEASKASGLSPSVLRIWELRYGWPSPKRKANGYRSYSNHQIEDLKRISELVKHGTTISQLIIDGLPRWPTDQVQRRQPSGLHYAKSLPRPAGHLEAKLQEEILAALEKRQTSVVKELLQRAMWMVRPQDEVLIALAPVLIALAELAEDERTLPDALELRQLVKERSLQLLRRFHGPVTTWIVPVQDRDQSLAALLALVLNQQGIMTQPWFQSGAPTTGEVVVATSTTGSGFPGRRIGAIPGSDREGLNEILAAEAPPQKRESLSAN